MAPSPLDADTQFSLVLALQWESCVTKGAIFLQLCGWMGCWDLFAGTLLDTDYQEWAGVFIYHENFCG